jgi:hypothetical protein
VWSMLIDKRETGGASPTMELYGFLRCLYNLLENGIEVQKTITDEHCQVRKFFRKCVALQFYLLKMMMTIALLADDNNANS